MKTFLQSSSKYLSKKYKNVKQMIFVVFLLLKNCMFCRFIFIFIIRLLLLRYILKQKLKIQLYIYNTKPQNATQRNPSEDPTAVSFLTGLFWTVFTFRLNTCTFWSHIPYKYILITKEWARRQKSLGKN